MAEQTMQELAPELKIETVGGISVVSFESGTNLDSGKVDRISVPLLAAARQPEPRSMLVDLQGVGYMASRALTMLIQVHRLVQQKSGQLRLSGLEPEVSEIFRVTNLATLFTIDADRQAALEKFQAAS